MKTQFLKKLKPVEILTLAYIVLTGIYIIIFSQKIDDASSLLGARVVLVALIVLFPYSKRFSDNFIRYAFPVVLTVYWYPETYYLNECLFGNLDHVFVGIEEKIFGCQPALEFCKTFPYRWFSELMSFGYFSYFLIVIFIAVYLYFQDKKSSEKAVFIIVGSFFLYYILFIILPVVGPQFYFLNNEVPDGYLFRYLLETVQSMGEKPTGAFPSSHVGMSLIFLIIIWKYCRRYFIYFVPIVIILIFSTVYIKAHYVIDVIGGAISAPIIYLCTDYIMKKFSEKNV